MDAQVHYKGGPGGDIVDRNGNILAQSSSVDSVVLQPSLVEDPEEVARSLACAGGWPPTSLEAAEEKGKGEV